MMVYSLGNPRTFFVRGAMGLSAKWFLFSRLFWYGSIGVLLRYLVTRQLYARVTIL
jgi:hypothetical protein